MKVKVVYEDNERIELKLEDTKTYFANALRRLSMTAVPVMAIDTITVYENTSSSFDEYISHRLGLIPLKTPSSYPKNSSCTLILHKEGPCTVYSSDLKSKDQSVKPSFPNIPIIKLLEHQSIRIEAHAVFGTGSKHAKFQPCLASYEKNTENSFSFFVESFHQLPPRKILLQAAELLEEKAEEFEKHLSKMK
ncbi:MAG: DNA-directed RNA polymerase subunit D [Candidatus Anstonellales archaeon]